MPVAEGFVVEGGFGIVRAEAVVNLPGDELGMFAEGGGHRADDALRKVPVNIAVQTGGAPRAFTKGLAGFINRQNLRMFFGEPDGRRGGGRAENDLDAGLPHEVHDAPEPLEIILALFALAQAPGEFAHADDVHAGGEHQLHVAFPAGLRLLRGACVRPDPMLRIIIYAKIHNLGWLGLIVALILGRNGNCAMLNCEAGKNVSRGK